MTGSATDSPEPVTYDVGAEGIRVRGPNGERVISYEELAMENQQKANGVVAEAFNLVGKVRAGE